MQQGKNLKALGDFLQSHKYEMRRPIEVGRKYLHKELGNNAWKGQRCFVLAGGFSLNEFDFNRLKGERVIAINRAHEYAPFADILFSIDNRYYDQSLRGVIGKTMDEKSAALNAWNNFTGYKVFLDTCGYKYDNSIYQVTSLGNVGCSDDITKGIYCGCNSGFAALNLAIVLGANPIYLLGYDGKYSDGKSHFHSGYDSTTTDSKLRQWAADLHIISSYAQKHGIEIINLNPDSEINSFPYGNIEKIVPLKRSWRAVSFYTKNTEYENDVMRLVESLDKFGIDHRIYAIPTMGNLINKADWRRHVYWKATFLQWALDDNKDKDIFWIDADAIVRKYPWHLDQIPSEYSFAIHNLRERELFAGTMYFRNDEISRNILKAWEIENKANENTTKISQTNLRAVVMRENFPYFNLPAGYAKIFDIVKDVEPIVEHFQSSRRYPHESH